jgi:hypothetical protein
MAVLWVAVCSEANVGLLLSAGNPGESRFLRGPLRSSFIRAACFSAPAGVFWNFALFFRSRSCAQIFAHDLQ